MKKTRTKEDTAYRRAQLCIGDHPACVKFNLAPSESSNATTPITAERCKQTRDMITNDETQGT